MVKLKWCRKSASNGVAVANRCRVATFHYKQKSDSDSQHRHHCKRCVRINFLLSFSYNCMEKSRIRKLFSEGEGSTWPLESHKK